MKNKIFQSRDLCLRALDTNSACAKSVRRNEDKMKLDDTVMVQFFGELIESYRQQIMDQEEARELSKKEKKFLADLREELELPNPQAYRLVTELFGCMLDISQIKQEQLYIQGIKDGIRIRKLVKEIEEGEEC